MTGEALIEMGLRGPRNEEGFLLRVPVAEALLWDIEHEVASSRRAWLPERRGWWIAASYLDTVVDIVLRFSSSVRVRSPQTGEERVLHAPERGDQRLNADPAE